MMLVKAFILFTDREAVEIFLPILDGFYPSTGHANYFVERHLECGEHHRSGYGPHPRAVFPYQKLSAFPKRYCP